MKYVLLSENVVVEIIPAVNPAFPDIPISKRYPASFIAGLIQVEDHVPVELHWLYDAELNIFALPVKIALLKDSMCIGITAATSIERARQLLENNMLDADDVQELPYGYGIGDSFVNGEWIKAQRPEVPEPEEVPEVYTPEEVTNLLNAFMQGFEEDDDIG